VIEKFLFKLQNTVCPGEMHKLTFALSDHTVFVFAEHYDLLYVCMYVTKVNILKELNSYL